MGANTVKFATLLLAVLGLVGGTTARASPARVAVPQAPDVAGRSSGKSLATAVKHALTTASVPVATAAELAKAARAAKVKLTKAGLKAPAAAKLAAKGNFAGVVIYRKGKNGAFAQLIDARGQVLFERQLRVTRGVVSDEDASNFAAATVAALGMNTQPHFADTTAAPTPPAATPAPAPDTAPAPPPENITAAYAGPEVAPTKEAPEPAAGYFLRVGLLAGAGERLFLTPSFSYTSSSPYAFGGAMAEVFPFRGFGLGVVADFSLGLVKDQLAGTAGTFNSSDLRVDAALAYRLRIFDGPFGTFVMPRIGFGMRHFDAPASTGLPGDDRTFLVAGLSLTQPIIPKYLRLSAGAAALPLSKLGSAGQSSYGPSSAFGLEWLAELGGDLIGNLEWALQVEQERFMDSYNTSPAGLGVDVYTGYTLQLRFRY